MSSPMRGAVICILAASLALAARSDEAEPALPGILPGAAFERVVGEAAKAIEQDLTIAEKDPQARRRAHGTAFLVAAYAQASIRQGNMKGDGEEGRVRAALRDAALKLAEAIGENKYAEAVDLARTLPKAKPDAATNTAELPLLKPDDQDGLLEDLMGLLKKRALGGLGVKPKPADPKHDGIEARLDLLADRTLPKADIAKQADGLALAAYQTAALADLVYATGPEKKRGALDPKDWRRWSRALRQASLDLADAAQMKDPERVRKAAEQAASTCKDCHKVSR